MHPINSINQVVQTEYFCDPFVAARICLLFPPTVPLAPSMSPSTTLASLLSPSVHSFIHIKHNLNGAKSVLGSEVRVFPQAVLEHVIISGMKALEAEQAGG